VVHYLAMALFQIEQGIERRFLKAPLGKSFNNFQIAFQ
jgi:bromodomain adjacent to zinc finger domain protein 1A